MGDLDMISPDYTLTCFYLFNNGGKEDLVKKLKVVDSDFKDRWLNDMELLSVSKELRVKITPDPKQYCLICNVETERCDFNLPRTELYADRHVMEQLQIDEESSYTTSHLLEIMKSFVKEHGHLPIEDIE